MCFWPKINILGQIWINCAVSRWYIELRVSNQNLLGQIWREMSIWFENTFLVVQAYRPETSLLGQIWREMSIWFENTFFVVQAYRLETSLLGQIWREISILGRKHTVLCIT